MAVVENENQNVIRAVFRKLTTPANLALIVVTAATVAITGPLGTYEYLAAHWRLIYWGSVILLAAIVSNLLRAILARVMPQRSPTFREAISAVLFTLLYSPIVIGLNFVVLGDLRPRGAEVEIAGIVFLVATMMGVIRTLGRGRLQAGSGVAAIWGVVGSSAAPPRDRPEMRVLHRPEGEPQPADSLSPLIRRLQLAPGSRIISMSVDNHYVEVRDSAGRTHRLLMRFADAVCEASGLNGLLVHRSHWVALDAVVRHNRRSGRDFVLLENGAEVPVSRTYRDALFAARPYLHEVPARAQAGTGTR